MRLLKVAARFSSHPFLSATFPASNGSCCLTGSSGRKRVLALFSTAALRSPMSLVANFTTTTPQYARATNKVLVKHAAHLRALPSSCAAIPNNNGNLKATTWQLHADSSSSAVSTTGASEAPSLAELQQQASAERAARLGLDSLQGGPTVQEVRAEPARRQSMGFSQPLDALPHWAKDSQQTSKSRQGKSKAKGKTARGTDIKPKALTAALPPWFNEARQRAVQGKLHALDMSYDKLSELRYGGHSKEQRQPRLVAQPPHAEDSSPEVVFVDNVAPAARPASTAGTADPIKAKLVALRQEAFKLQMEAKQRRAEQLMALGDAALKELITEALHDKAKLKIGRRGPRNQVCEDVFTRWNTRKTVRIRVEDRKVKAFMPDIMRELEQKTGGLVIWQSGGTLLLYRGHDWPRADPLQASTAGIDMQSAQPPQPLANGAEEEELLSQQPPPKDSGP